MSENMNEALFDFVVEHALGDCLKDEITQLNKMPETIPISAQFKKFFKKLLAKRKRIRFLHSMPTYTKRCAITLLTMITLLSGVLVTQPPVYAAVKNVFYEWGKEFVNYNIPGQEEWSRLLSCGIKADYLPDQYELFEATIQPHGFSVAKYFNPYDDNPEESAIELKWANLSDSKTGGVDSEHGTQLPLLIDGLDDVLYIQSNDPQYPNYLMWSKDGYFFRLIFPASIDIYEVEKMAQNVNIVS